jgi:hypothetical protein
MRPVDKDDFDILRLKTTKKTIAGNAQGSQPVSTRQIVDKDVQECLDYYARRYEKQYRGKPVFRCYNEAKTTMKDILRLASGDKPLVLRMIDTYLGDTTQWFRDRKHVLDVLKENVQPIAAAANLANKQAAPPLFIRAETRCIGCGAELVIVCDAKEIENARCNRCNGRQQ